MNNWIARWSRRDFLRSAALVGSAGYMGLRLDRALANSVPLSLVPVSGEGRLVSAIEVRNGLPQMVVNGKVEVPLLFFHGSVFRTTAMTVEVGTEWKEYGFSFTAPVTDDDVGVHIRNADAQGIWWVDSMRLFEEKLGSPAGHNLLDNPDFEEGAEPGNRWTFFVTPAGGAKASCMIDTRNPASGKASLKVVVENPGTEAWHVHLYQSGLRIEQGKTYVFKVKLRSDQPRKLEILAAHQGPPWTVYGGQSHHAVEQVKLSRDAGFHLRTFDMTLPWPHEGAPPDYTSGDLELRAHLALDPQALLVPRFHTDAPRWWKERHPDHVMLYEDGRHQMVSVASQEWRKDAEEAVRLFVRHLEKEFGDHILGYHVCGQSGGEWVYDQTWTPPLPNFETPFRDGFRTWLRTMYPTREALRQAWQDPHVDFTSVEVPSAAERREGKDGTFRDPKSQRKVIDFFAYSQVAIVEPLERFSRAVKDEVQGKKLVFAFYGYLFDVAGFVNGPQVSGHLLTDRVIRCPSIDVLCAPISYFDREAGGSGPFMAPVDSIQLLGKLWSTEDDTRTYLSAENAGSGRVGTLQGTQWVHQRNFAHLLVHECGLWWMDLEASGWLASKAIWDNLARLREVWRSAANVTRPLQPDVAVIIDDRSSLYLPCDNALTSPLMMLMRYQINRMGTSVGYYLLRDLCDGIPPEAKAYLFLNSFVVSPEQRQAIHRAVHNKGKWAVWFYAPGYLDPSGTPGDMSALTGLPLQRLPKPQWLTVNMVPSSFVANRVPREQLSFGDNTPRTPAFTLGEDAAGHEMLGYYAGTRTPAVVCVRRPEWSSVFVGSTTLSTGVLRAIGRAAGAHVWLESDDVLIAGNDFVAVHASTEGRKELLVPAGVAAKDLSTGTATPQNGRIVLTMQQGETRLFRLTRQ